MKNEIIIIGIILVILGSVLLYLGYQKLQPTKADKTISYFKDFAEGLSGEKIKGFPKKDNTESIILILLGSISFIAGLMMILKSRNNVKNTLSDSHINSNSNFYCPNCSSKLERNAKFCPECGNEI